LTRWRGDFAGVLSTGSGKTTPGCPMGAAMLRMRAADMIERHWSGIAAYRRPENKVSLGFVEGLNNKIRVFQRRAYGLKDEEYLRLKVLSCMLPELCPPQKPPTRSPEDPKFLTVGRAVL
jgi:hypothetical protein